MRRYKNLQVNERGEIIENKFFFAEAIIEGDPNELAIDVACVMRTQNSQDHGTRRAFMAPATWMPTNKGVRFGVVGKAEYELWDENKDDGLFDRKRYPTTMGVAEFLEEQFGVPFSVRPLLEGINHMDDMRLMDSFKAIYKSKGTAFRHYNEYPNAEDILSAGNQESSLLGNQGDYAAASPYFDIVLHTKKSSKKFGREAYAAACRNLYENAGVLLSPRMVFQHEDGTWEIRAAGCCHHAGRISSGRLYIGQEVPASDAVADPVSYYLDATVSSLRTFKTTAEHYDDVLEAQRIADEIGMLGIPEPEDFIIKDRAAVLEDDKIRAAGGSSALLEPELTGEEELERLIGLEETKRQIREFVAFATTQKKRGGPMPSLNMVFKGNPGTGKTEVARTVAHMLYDAGVLPKQNVFIETEGAALNPSDVLRKAVVRARRGVLFIDEAYALCNPTAIATLVKAMEDCRRNYERDGFIVIMAGYPQEMDWMLSRNPGMRDRMACYVNFEDYTVSELIQVADLFLKDKGYRMEKKAHAFLEDQIELIDMYKDEDFGNARLMRRIVERCIIRQSSMHGTSTIIKLDVVEDVFKDEFAELVGKQSRTELRKAKERTSHNGPELSGDEKLERLIGMEGIKRQIREFLDFAAVQATRHAMLPQMHMLMRGNPGTGKTTVARIVAQMAFERGLLLRNDRFVEGDRETLVANYVGLTALKTKYAIKRARHGVLFIDEAYELGRGNENDFGKEALATLVKAMEDCREDYKRNGFICIMAGYTNLMNGMVKVNPGLRDRFGLTLDFPDYTPEEMMQIFNLYLKEGGYTIAKNAAVSMLKNFEQMVARKDDDFANGRLARKVYERCQMRQAMMHGANSHIKLDVVESVFKDPDITTLLSSKGGIGFCVA